MAQLPKKSVLIYLSLLVLGRGVVSADENCDGKTDIVCYYASWAVYRVNQGQFTTDKIDPTLCTKIVYSFAGLNIDLQVASIDNNADITLGGYANFTKLKEKNACLRTALAVGGWNEGSLKYSIMAYSEESRENFADHVLKFIAYYGFDGLDLDWEYPTARGGIAEDKKNFVELLKTVKKKLSPWGYELSIAVALDTDYYDIATIAANVDYVHVMAYDVTSGESNVTGLLAPLSIIKSKVSVWLENGLPSGKLILGVPTYARCFNLLDNEEHGIGAAVDKTTCGGQWTDEDGFLSFYEVQEYLSIGICQGSEISDDSVYAWCSDMWMTYDNEETVASKTKYVLESGLGGIMVWSIDTDDFLGLHGNKFSLLSSIYRTINEG
ncbi:acidic mammalian chitinase-like [Dendroctonus ponderosae]|uniref:acidic mammalian chitinase-like n=1 Tax=Dendroctonus ponderosae TaxID=77166 RepID=UPI0020361C5B|nr:acidic mammalian chitinase-like [Dendroctonus ponderosae]